MSFQYKETIHNLIDWERIEERLSLYPNIQGAFPISELQKDMFVNVPPYYCHPLAYILGVWNSEDTIANFDALLAHAATITGWGQRGRLNVTQAFQSFHTLRWELQVAKILSDLSIDKIKWRESGPDLEVEVDGETIYIECYCYQKFYGKIIFLEDVLSRIDSRLHVKTAWALKAIFPKTDEQYSELLEHILSQVTPSGVEILEKQEVPYIYLTHEYMKNVFIYFENEHVQIRDHKVLHVGAGDTDLALETAVKEALRHKADSNNLTQYHPNIIAINMSMSLNFQLGRNRAVDLKIPPPDVTLPDNIDGALIHNSSAVDLSSFDTVFTPGSKVEVLWQKINGTLRVE